jgi:hypothetical protein
MSALSATPYLLSQLARLVEKRRLEPQREIALSHDPISNRFTASPGDKT